MQSKVGFISNIILSTGCLLISALRSTLSSIYLSVFCKADDIKKFGYPQVLDPLLSDLKTWRRWSFRPLFIIDGWIWCWLLKVFRPALHPNAGGTFHGLCVPDLQQRGRKCGPTFFWSAPPQRLEKVQIDGKQMWSSRDINLTPQISSYNRVLRTS